MENSNNPTINTILPHFHHISTPRSTQISFPSPIIADSVFQTPFVGARAPLWLIEAVLEWAIGIVAKAGNGRGKGSGAFQGCSGIDGTKL